MLLRNKKIQHSTKLGESSPWQNGLLISIIPALIGLLSAILGTFVGQRLGAATESDKVIRENLETAYYKTLSFEELATRVNMAALSDTHGIDLNITQANYNKELTQFGDHIRAINSIVEIYSDDLENPMQKLNQCSHAFSHMATDILFVNLQVNDAGAYNSPAYKDAAKLWKYPDKVNSVALKRQECVNTAVELRKAIKSEIKKHLTKNLF